MCSNQILNRLLQDLITVYLSAQLAKLNNILFYFKSDIN